MYVNASVSGSNASRIVGRFPRFAQRSFGCRICVRSSSSIRSSNTESGLPPQAPAISFSASFVSSLRGCVFSHQATVLFSPVSFISVEELARVLGGADALDPERVERVAEHEVVLLLRDLPRQPLAACGSSASEKPPQSIVHTSRRAFSSCGKVASRASSFSANSSSGPSFSIIRIETGRGTVNGG